MTPSASIGVAALPAGVAIATIAVLAAISVIAVSGMVLFRLVNDLSIPLPRRKPDFMPPRSVLAVFAHPDDEIMVAGSLIAWRRAGAAIHLLYCTRGEDGPTGGLVSRDGLGDLRERELSTVARLIGASSLTVLRYPDRRLESVALVELQLEIKVRVASVRPDTVICFDDALGLYGHPDHAWSGRATRELLLRDRLGVSQLAVMTLCRPQIALALKASRTFRERFRPDPGLPPANLAIGIARHGSVKKKICLAHRSQREVVGDVQPFITILPAWFYYRVFAREYFSLTRLETDPATSKQGALP